MPLVEILPGEFRSDIAVWEQRSLAIRGIGRRPVLIADGKSAEVVRKVGGGEMAAVPTQQPFAGNDKGWHTMPASDKRDNHANA